jgi:hypothetical protein
MKKIGITAYLLNALSDVRRMLSHDSYGCKERQTTHLCFCLAPVARTDEHERGEHERGTDPLGLVLAACQFEDPC